VGFFGGDIIILLLIYMKMKITMNTLDGQLVGFSSHHKDRDIPDAEGSFSLGF
jgi:hypothetical protein